MPLKRIGMLFIMTCLFALLGCSGGSKTVESGLENKVVWTYLSPYMAYGSEELYQGPKIQGPDDFDNHLFDAHMVSGYIGHEDEQLYLYSSKTDYLYGNHENAFVIDRKTIDAWYTEADRKPYYATVEDYMAQLHGQLVYVHGMLDFQQKDKTERTLGRIAYYRWITPYGEETERINSGTDPLSKGSVTSENQVSIYRFFANPLAYAGKTICLDASVAFYDERLEVGAPWAEWFQMNLYCQPYDIHAFKDSLITIEGDTWTYHEEFYDALCRLKITVPESLVSDLFGSNYIQCELKQIELLEQKAGD